MKFLRKIYEIMGFLIILSMGLSSFAQQTKDENELLKKCEGYYKNGEYEKAIACYNEAINLIGDMKKLMNARMSLACTYFTINDLENAKEQVQKVLELNPSYRISIEEFVPPFVEYYRSLRNQLVVPVSLKSSPSNATIIVDGKVLGKTPIRTELFAKKIKIKLVKSGYLPYEGEITIVAGKENEILVDFGSGKHKNYNWKTLLVSSVIWTGLTYFILMFL